jgi:hypothetical protein
MNNLDEINAHSSVHSGELQLKSQKFIISYVKMSLKKNKTRKKDSKDENKKNTVN